MTVVEEMKQEGDICSGPGCRMVFDDDGQGVPRLCELCQRRRERQMLLQEQEQAKKTR